MNIILDEKKVLNNRILKVKEAKLIFNNLVYLGINANRLRIAFN